MHFLQESSRIILLVCIIACLPAISSQYLRAVFDMSGIKGEILFMEDTNGYTRISPNLTGINSNLTWKIHKYPIVYRGNHMHTCQTLYTGGMFDPSGHKYNNSCNNTMQNMCAIGDLNGKHGNLTASTGILLDPNLPISGPNSIFGRSIVLYNDGSTPLACALIDYDDVITAVATFRGAISGVTGTVRFRQPRGNSSSDTSVEVDLFYSNDVTTGSHHFTLEMADKKLPEEGVPSFEGDYCKMETPQVIFNHVSVPLASNGPSSERLHFSAKNLPLSGSSSVISKTLILKNKNVPIICGSVTEVLPMEGEAVFDIDGVKGFFRFKQNSELSPTIVTAEISGLKKKANTYHVHVYRVLDEAMKEHRNSHGMCSDGHVAGHWKPYNTQSAVPGTSTVDKYEVGDMSGKYGVIGAKDGISLNRKDYNLPLFGQNSILFRSMVIHYKNTSRWVCSNINPKGATFQFKTKTHFVGPAFNGTAFVEQASFIGTHAASHITTFFLDLQYMNASHIPTSSHNWHIHEKQIIKDQMLPMGKRCKSALGHYNPYKVSLNSNYSNTCGPRNLLRCELGDISSKVGKYAIGGGKNRFTESENYYAGLNTILTHSIVVHAKDSGSPRLGCANMELISDSFVRKDMIFHDEKEFKNDEFSEKLSTALKVNKWRVVVHENTEKYRETCKKARLVFIDSTSSNLGKDFEDLKKDWPENLMEFKPVSDPNSEEACVDSGLNLQASCLTFIIAFLLTRFFA